MGVSATTKTYTVSKNTQFDSGQAGQNPILGEAGGGQTGVTDFLIENATLGTEKAIGTPAGELDGNKSGAMRMPGTNRVFVCRNNSRILYEYQDGDFANPVRAIDLDLDVWADNEALCWMGANEFAITAENGGTNRFFVFDWSEASTLVPKQEIIYAANGTSNRGPEGIVWLPNEGPRGSWVAFQEITPRAVYKIERPDSQYDNTDLDYSIDSGAGGALENKITSIVNFDTRYPSGELAEAWLVPGTTQVCVVSDDADIIRQWDVMNVFNNYNGGGETRPIDIISEKAIPSNYNFEGLVDINDNLDLILIDEDERYYDLTALQITGPVINQLDWKSYPKVNHGTTYNYTPTLSAGNKVLWSIVWAPYGVSIDRVTGQITWDTNHLIIPKACRIILKAENSAGSDLLDIVVLVDGTPGNTAKFVYVGPGETLQTLAAARSVGNVNSGDCIIIKNGTYHGSESSLNSFDWAMDFNHYFPAGTANMMTSYFAETAGGVYIDGQNFDGSYHDEVWFLYGNTPHPDSNVTDNPWIGTVDQDYQCINGIQFGLAAQTPLKIEYIDYVSVELCCVNDGEYGAVCSVTDQTNCSNPNGLIRRCGHVLVEDCFAFGGGRYAFQFRETYETVRRNSIARMDRHGGFEPLGGFSDYTCQNGVMYNCYVVDSVQYEAWSHYVNQAGAFTYPATGEENLPYGLETRECMVLNCHMPCLGSNGGWDVLDGNWLYDQTHYISDFVAWDVQATISPGNTLPSVGISSIAPANVEQSTWGLVGHHADFEAEISTPGSGFEYPSVFYSRTVTSDINNSIMYRTGYNGQVVTNISSLFRAGTASLNIDYCNEYGWQGDGSRHHGDINETNPIATNPTENGLRYICMIDEGSTLETAGNGGVRVGADIRYQRGATGRFRGQALWNVLQTDKRVWANNAAHTLYKSKARAWTYDGLGRDDQPISINGNFGMVAVGQTLSNYVFAYRGDVAPVFDLAVIGGNGEADIYWQPPAPLARPNIAGFNIYIDGVLTYQLGPNTFFKKIPGLSNGTSYEFEVRAVHNSYPESGTLYKESVTPSA